jgi:hypothetical protein
MLDATKGTKWHEAVEIALAALKEKVGYCEDCRIRYEDDLK